MEQNRFDVIVIGGGPAGYTAGLYAARAALKTVILEQSLAGGQMVNTYEIDNYPGADVGISGADLALKMKDQAEQFGAVSRNAAVTALALASKEKQVILSDGTTLTAGAVILATGASPRPLGAEGEDKYRGRGVSYCATCDGMFFRKKTVAVVGGGNTAVEDALFLAKICKQVYLIHRRDTFRASRIYVDLAEQTENITILTQDTVTEILGDKRVSGVKLQSGKTLDCDGVFVAVGNVPNSRLAIGILDLDDAGYILADETTRTKLPGVFAAGDVRKKELRQIVTATADGAMAAHMAEKYLLENK